MIIGKLMISHQFNFESITKNLPKLEGFNYNLNIYSCIDGVFFYKFPSWWHFIAHQH